MNLLLTSEQTACWDRVARFAGEELGDDIEARDQAMRFSRSDWDRCGGFGLAGLPVPAEYGGHGADLVTTMVAFDAFGYACRDNGLIFSIAAHLWSCVMTVLRFGSAEQKQRYLPGLAAGTLIGAHAMTEPDTGSDAFAARMTAEPADGGWLLNGEKTFITNAPVADVFVVFAVSARGRGPFGLTCFLADASAPGLTVGTAITKMGLRTSPMASVSFHDCFVPASSVLGRPGLGMAIFNTAIHLERAYILASALGTMQRQIERSALALSAQPQAGARAGGGSPGRDLVPHRLAGMAARLHGSRLVAYGLASRMDHGKTGPEESALVKIKLSEAFLHNSRDAWDNDLALGLWPAGEAEREVRDAVASRIYSGTNEIQRDIAARHLGS
jgi:alkylation response protein AidB-like acyl-CoA dehydrogenase